VRTRSDREAIFWHFPHYNQHPSAVPSSVIRKGPWKLIETFDPEGIELYNLEDDLSETTNLAAEQPELVAEASPTAQRLAPTTSARR
jgi:arylsulfatase A